MKHANAQLLSVRLEADAGATVLRIVDDGVGIRAGAPKWHDCHLHGSWGADGTQTVAGAEVMMASIETEKQPARVLIVDDHPVVRLGIRQMIAADPTLSVCGEAESGEVALQIIADHEVDLAIVDLSLKGLSGLELIRRLRESHPHLAILVLSMHDEALFAERAIRAGARGYIMKQAAIVGLSDAIRQVLAGRIYVSEQVAQQVLSGIGHVGGWNGERLGMLTDRELQVFEMIGRGASTAEIAERLSISVKTVETYRVNIKTKLDLKDATALVRYATTWIEHL